MRVISKKKVNEVMDILRSKKLDSMLFLCSDSYHDSNIEYLTGFRQERSGAFSCLIATKKKMTLIVSALDSDQAHAEADVNDIIEIRKNRFSEVLKEVLGKSKKIGISNDMPIWMNCLLKGKKTFDISSDIMNVRSVKEPKELEYIERACSVANHGIKFIEKEFYQFKTCRELAIELEAEMLRNGADEISFPSLVTTGKRGLWIHPYPAAANEKLSNTGIIDFGARVGGYCSDVTIPFTNGELTEKQKLIIQTVKNAYSESLSKLEIGAKCSHIFDAANNIIAKNGFVFKHSLGHGIGLDVHEYPNLSPKPQKPKKDWKDTELREGMVFTIEPGIYEKEGGFRLENDFMMTRKGSVALTKSRLLEF